MEGSTAQRWYYDACTLDDTKGTYAEMYNGHKRHSIVPFLSNLSIGEACSNDYRKKGKEATESFFNLLNQLDKLGVLNILHHKGLNKIFEEVMSEFELDISDALHLATAIANNCCNLRTIDSDLYRLPSAKVKKVAAKFNVHNFVITKMSS